MYYMSSHLMQLWACMALSHKIYIAGQYIASSQGPFPIARLDHAMVVSRAFSFHQNSYPPAQPVDT